MLEGYVRTALAYLPEGTRQPFSAAVPLREPEAARRSKRTLDGWTSEARTKGGENNACRITISNVGTANVSISLMREASQLTRLMYPRYTLFQEGSVRSDFVQSVPSNS